MEEEFTPTLGPFFKFTDEAAWLTAARAAGLWEQMKKGMKS